MSEFAEKTEQPTPRKLEEAQQRGQIPRSAEVQTLFALMAGTTALAFTGGELWRGLSNAQFAVLGHLSDIAVTYDALPAYFAGGLLFLAKLVAPVVVALLVAGPDQRTLPREMFSGLRDSITPALTAVATILIVCSTAMFLLVQSLQRRARRRA